MKILFMDVQGVLAHDGTVERAQATGESWNSSFYQAALVDPVAVQRVMRIVKEPGAKIVLVSAWRNVEFQRNGLHRAFATAGGLDGRGVRALFAGSTPTMNDDRPSEITAWLKAHPEVKEYVVLDDEPVPGHPQAVPLPDPFEGGLQEPTVESAIQILGSA